MIGGLQCACLLQLHFTDLACCRVILHGLGLRVSTVGQLGGGVSVCLSSLVGFDWGQGMHVCARACMDTVMHAGWEDFCLIVGKALWGRSAPVGCNVFSSQYTFSDLQQMVRGHARLAMA